MKITLRITSLVTLLLFTVSCSSVLNRAEIPHPPAYKDFLKLQSPKYEEMTREDFFLRRINLIMCISSCDKADEILDDKKAAEIKQKCIKNESDERIVEEIIQNLQFKKAMQFTENEMNIITQSQNPRAMVGAGLQSEIDETLGTEVLKSASSTESSGGLALVSLIDRYLALLPRDTAEVKLPANLQSSIVQLLKADPNNALSHYLAAYKLHTDKKDKEALLQLKEGNARTMFISYSTERYFAVVEAAELLGYPRFTARQHAMSFSIPSEIYSKLGHLCSSLVKGDKREDYRAACLEMGEKIELASRDTYEKLQGLLIQGYALQGSVNTKHAELLAQIREKQKDTSKSGTKLIKIPFRDIPEAVWLQYFELYFNKDEESAVNFIEAFHKKAKQENGN